MNSKINKFFTSSNFDTFDVDRLVISAYLEINQINITENLLLQQYLIKRWNPEYLKLQEFIAILDYEYQEFNFENLIELFEFVISPSDRIVNGAIYTPLIIREYIVSTILEKYQDNLDNLKICDIACGCAGFLYTAALKLKKLTGNSYKDIFEHQIYGLDIQAYSVIRSKLLLSLLALSEGEDIVEFTFNFFLGDSLDFKWSNHIENFKGFNIIIGNPPYVSAKNLANDVRQKLKNWKVCNSGNPDLYIPFFQIGFENLNEDGILGYITMNSFFKSLNGRALREYFKSYNVAMKIIDFGAHQIFQTKSTYTCICFLEKRQQDYVQFYKSLSRKLPRQDGDYSKIAYDNLDSRNGWNLDSSDIINRIEKTGTPFGKLYKTRHGIATLKNDLYIFKPVYEDNNFFYLMHNNRTYPIEKAICKDILNSNKLSRKVNLEEIKQKIIFPYDDASKPKTLQENFLMLEYPNAYKYLLSIKQDLAKRDKGNGKYEKWFSYGRTQSLEKVTTKMFFPKFSDKIPSYLIINDENLLFYNGQAIIGHSESEMSLIKKIMESRLFWFYIKKTSKPYSSNYYSLNGTYIKNFGIPNFNESELQFLLSENNRSNIDEFLENYYDVKITEY